MFTRSQVTARPLPPLPERFGVRSAVQVRRDVAEMLRTGLRRQRFQFGPSSLGLLRPELSLPAYAGLVPGDRLAPVYNLFDRTGGGQHYSQRVTRRQQRDFRGGRLSYDEHDGVDFVCPIGTPLCAAAPGVVVMIRDRWLRGGLTVAVDHGAGVLTQYTHCSRAVAAEGQVVRRGEPVALSGAAGADLVNFFPWVPPHVHFLVSVDGRAVDPFPIAGEGGRPGLWLDPGDPRPSGPLAHDPAEPEPSAVDLGALRQIAARCTDPYVQRELAHRAHAPGLQAALLEDALAHDAWAFPADCHGRWVRPGPDPAAAAIRLTLPLPVEQYDGLRFADLPTTAP